MTREQANTRILLVEDDINLGFLLVEFLESNGFDVKLCRDGESGNKAFQMSRFDFCIIDIMLPEMDGFTLIERIKETNRDVPVIILSARSLKEDKIKGFRLGIDDFLAKPFDEEELLYRIRAILNRSASNTAEKKESRTYKLGKYEFDQVNQVLKINNKCIRLTIKESTILGMLAASVNNLVKREEIMLSTWGATDYYTGRSLDVFISKLRSYLKDDHEIRILTIPTIGYILECIQT